jgi:peptidoglycan/LPS O-acetylase OafA/YrhL
MPITINDPLLSTDIFIAIFVFVLLVSLRRGKDQRLFPPALTSELKGLAILAVIFSHVGYFLSTDDRFLFPLSIMAGVGVNLFLFLSGYGLTMSALKTEMTVIGFYKKRLLKLFTPFWLVILGFFLLDFFLLHKSYDWPYIIRSMLGLFPRADLFLDVDSPLWFFTPILFYYLIFPLVFFKKRPWLTAIIIYTVSYLILLSEPPVSIDVLHLYQLHLLAFPLGIAFASLFFQPFFFSRILPARAGSFLYDLRRPDWIRKMLDKFKMPNVFARGLKILKRPAYHLISIVLLILTGFMAYYSGVGGSPDKEQTISLVTMSAIIFFFMMKKFEIRALYIVGLSAYEIYLIHWPLMSRYDLFFKYFPGWLAMILYLGLFLILAFLLKKLINQIYRFKILI